MNGSKLKQLIDKNKYSVIDLLNGLLPRAKTKHITSILAKRLNDKGLTNAWGGEYFATSVQNTLYKPDRVDMNILDEVVNYLIENGVSKRQIERFEVEATVN